MEYVDLILPFAIPQALTYEVPASLAGGQVQPGMRVLVALGKKTCCALVYALKSKAPEGFTVKPILALIDSAPVVTERQWKLWEWIASYYMCTLGEIMTAALPNTLRTNHDPHTETFIRLHSRLHDEEKLLQALDSLSRAKKQEKLLLDFLMLARIDQQAIHISAGVPVSKKKLMALDGASAAAFNACVQKQIFETWQQEINHHNRPDSIIRSLPDLSAAQQTAFREIHTQWQTKDVVLLHGVTASGKTEIYAHLIREQLEKGRQVLYLVPEIALTTQLIGRLQQFFGNLAGIYHSRYSPEERAEVYRAVSAVPGADADTRPIQVIVGARSSVLLPFRDLGLVIVDEEHETTFKQFDPAPRYHARDTAIILASYHKAKVLLGTATPAIETSYNAESGKFGRVKLSERFHKICLPQIEVVDTVRMQKKKQMSGCFSQPLLTAIGEALAHEEQVILFQNRRGFSPFVQCPACGYIPRCRQCSVSLTWHKQQNMLMCHYCGYSEYLPESCPDCHQAGMQNKGFGTERVEEELQQHFPTARLARLDVDVTRKKHAWQSIINDFEAGKKDILTGTQMVTKGLDFARVSLVGILNADTLLNFPDFRAHERSFQLMTQVSGRAGRKDKQGRVIIQTSQPDSPVIRFVQQGDYTGLFNLQLIERREFRFPPYSRLISVTLKHRQEETLRQAAVLLKDLLLPVLQQQLTGPFRPVVSRIQNRYLACFWIRTARKDSAAVKQFLATQLIALHRQKGLSNIETVVDVDTV